MVDLSQSPGYAPRTALADAFNNNNRVIKAYDALQTTVLENAFINAGAPEASTTPADTAIPIEINGITYYLKVSTNP